MSLDLGRKSLEEAVKAGASYADVRIGEILDENLTVKNGVPEETKLLKTKGFGIRVILKDAWGFASSVDLTGKEVKEMAHKAVAIAKASAKVKKKAVSLKKTTVKKDKYSTPMKKDPFKVPLEEKMGLDVEIVRKVGEYHENGVQDGIEYDYYPSCFLVKPVGGNIRRQEKEIEDIRLVDLKNIPEKTCI